ncbi:MAG: hypothetical protein ACRDSN_08185 [Pseudonocardiaceae bacterium]
MTRSTGALALPHQPGRVGQGTAIEQSRAAAEVFASVMSAKQAPRDQQLALRSMKEVCGMKELAERAFFRFSRGGSQVTGPTVHLARELARCWGNIHYGVSELRRDDEHGQSEMQAFAWDLETNARAASIFIVPHTRDKRGGAEPLTEARDIYENNANAGARRVREAIYSVLPLWFVEQAQELCRATLTSGGGKPLQQRIAEVIDYFGRVGVGEQQLADKVGKAATQWTELDLAPLGVIYRSIKNGEVSRDDEFPPATAKVTAADLTGRAPDAQPVPEVPAADEQPRKAQAPQMRRIFALLKQRGIGEDGRLAAASMALKRDVGSFKDLTADDAAQLIARLEQVDKAPPDDTPAEQPDQPADTEGEQP